MFKPGLFFVCDCYFEACISLIPGIIVPILPPFSFIHYLATFTSSNTTLLEKYQTYFFPLKNPVDFNEVRLHEATLNLLRHT